MSDHRLQLLSTMGMLPTPDTCGSPVITTGMATAIRGVVGHGQNRPIGMRLGWRITGSITTTVGFLLRDTGGKSESRNKESGVRTPLSFCLAIIPVKIGD